MSGLSPIHVAAFIGNEEIVRLMISVYPSLARLLDNDGYTPLHYACMGNSATDLISTLLELGCDVNARNRNGKTAIHISIERENLPHFKTLVDAGKFFCGSIYVFSCILFRSKANSKGSKWKHSTTLLDNWSSGRYAIYFDSKSS